MVQLKCGLRGYAGAALLSLLSGLLAGGASAAPVPVTFDFTTPKADAASYLYTDVGSGLTLTVTPWTFTLNPTVLTPGYEVTQVGSGLGVEATSTDSQPQIEAKQGLNELAMFSFSNTVVLKEISFSSADSGNPDDTMRFFKDNAPTDGTLEDFGNSVVIKNPPDNALDLITTYTLANVTGKLFGFGAYLPPCLSTQPNGCPNIEWRITSLSLTFDKGPGDTGPVVPIPAALPLLASGLGVLGAIGWRRRRKATAG